MEFHCVKCGKEVMPEPDSWMSRLMIALVLAAQNNKTGRGVYCKECSKNIPKLGEFWNRDF
jgi:DNA-directed RNA polymerase subunit RPC12/RpoP